MKRNLSYTPEMDGQAICVANIDVQSFKGFLKEMGAETAFSSHDVNAYNLHGVTIIHHEEYEVTLCGDAKNVKDLYDRIKKHVQDPEQRDKAVMEMGDAEKRTFALWSEQVEQQARQREKRGDQPRDWDMSYYPD